MSSRYEGKGGKNGFLDFAIYKKVIDEAKQFLLKIDFADWGEPFLNPQIYDMIRYAEKNKIVTSASTNLHKFKNNHDLEKLISSGISFLTISLHGASPETYEIYQPGKNYYDVINKIKFILNNRNGKKPIVDLRFAITKKNQHELSKMHHLAKNLGVDYSIHTASLNLRFYLDKPKYGLKLVEEWAQNKHIDLCDNKSFEKERINILYETILKNKTIDVQDLDNKQLTARHFCLDPWESIVINCDGTVSLCCTDYYKYTMGNVINESIIKIWNNEKYQNVRKYLMNFDINCEDNIPCKYCIRY